MVSALDDASVARLRAARFTYDDVGATLGSPPPRWPSFRRSRVLERRDLAAAAEDVLHWQVQERAGLAVSASHARVQEDAVVEIRIGVGPLVVTAPCRVVTVIEEPDRVGFVYGTLAGHPERGEELFLLERLDDGALQLTVAAFSRPGTLPARLAGPAGRIAQHLQTSRYLRALDRPARTRSAR